MAVISVEEIAERDADVDSERKQNTTRTYLVITDDPRDDSHTVRGDGRLPRIGDVYFGGLGADSRLRVARKTAKQRSGTRTVWEVTVVYDTNTPQLEDEGSVFDLRPPPSFSTVIVNVIADKDKDGDAIVNSAGDAFDPPVEDEDAHMVVRFRRYYPLSAENDIRDKCAEFTTAVNSSPWYGAGSREWKCNSITANPEAVGDEQFYAVDFEFEHNPDSWDLSILDQGYRRLETGVRLQIVDDNGSPPAQPVLLDGSGEVLDPADDPVFLTFRRRREKDFDLLGIL